MTGLTTGYSPCCSGASHLRFHFTVTAQGRGSRQQQFFKVEAVLAVSLVLVVSVVQVGSVDRSQPDRPLSRAAWARCVGGTAQRRCLGGALPRDLGSAWRFELRIRSAAE